MNQYSNIPDKADLQRHVFATYVTLRIGMAVIAAALPFSLLISGAFANLEAQGSMSAYYWAGVVSKPPGRVWFVGGLFAIAAFLYLYKGFTKGENLALNAAGLLALGVAYFPMEWNCGADNKPIDANIFSYCVAGWNPHGACAVLLFLCLVYVTFLRARDTLPALPSETLRSRFRKMYGITSLAMVAGPIAATLMHALQNNYSTLTFWLEATGVLAFAAYWAIKSVEMRYSAAGERAARGEGLPAASQEAPSK